MIVNLIWPDGTIVSGASFQEVEDALRSSMPYPYPSRRAFRADMRHRAAVWSGRPQKRPYGRQSSEQFILQLVNADMAMLEVTDQPTQLPATPGEGGTR